MKYVVCLHLYIPWKFGERGSTPRRARRPSLSFFLFVCPSHYDDRHRKPRWCVYALNLGGTGISPPDSFSFRSSFRFRSRSSSCSTTSGFIFYCSGSRQFNHSSSELHWALFWWFWLYDLILTMATVLNTGVQHLLTLLPPSARAKCLDARLEDLGFWFPPVPALFCFNCLLQLFGIIPLIQLSLQLY